MKVIQRLYELQELELGGAKDSPEAKLRIESIRKETPEPIMGHYDRLLARGKRAVAMVRHGVCTGCRIKLPSGSYAALIRDDDISMCENCGRYLLLSPEEQPEPIQLPAQQVQPPPPPVEQKPKPKRRTAKQKKQVPKEPASVRSES
ncbi:MAG TPA: C4-type zinc ribbon domain-containing protein [Verrucomicrobiota bacterium]|nr:C4-type zinc ribbon domain-containing protein [Verrucomicrobiota bacterium]